MLSLKYYCICNVRPVRIINSSSGTVNKLSHDFIDYVCI